MTDASLRGPRLDEIHAAAARIEAYVHRTPVYTCRALDELAGAALFFKCENLQKCGSFKIRGASNAIAQMDSRALEHGVATHSSGNHGAALALAARNFGAKAYVVMPETAPSIKKRAVAGYGAEVSFCGPSLSSREESLAALVARTGASVVHPYDDDRIIAGQGTLALELLEAVRDLDLVVVPVGGGGLISGVSTAVTALSPTTRVIGVEPEGADDARRSIESGRRQAASAPNSIADGLLAELSERTFRIIRNHVDRIVAVSEAEIITAMRLILERMKLIAEPSAAVALAAILSGAIGARGTRIGIVLSGGNADLDALPWTAQR